jgi:hypothetical protein
MADDRYGRNGDTMLKDERREKPYLVATHVLSKEEALENYSSIANGYNHFIEHWLPGIEQRVNDFTAIVREIRDENRANHESIKAAVRAGMANIAKDVLSETRRQLQAELTAAAIGAPSKNVKPTAPLGLGEGFDPELTPHGGIRIDHIQLAALQERLDRQDRDAELKAAEARGAEMALDTERANAAKFKKRVLFWLKVAGATLPILAVVFSLLVHVLHLWDSVDPPARTPANLALPR